MNELFISGIAPDTIVFGFAKFDGTQRGKVLSVLRNLDQIFRLCSCRNFNFALLPHARNIRLPRFAHAADESVRTAEQEHVRAQCVPTSEHAQVLQNDRLEQGSHQLIGMRADLLQTIDVSLSKNPALPCYFVQLNAVVSLLGQLFDRNFQLGIDLVDHRARTAGTLVIHRRNFLFPTRLVVIFEDDDFRVLAAQLHN